VGSVKKMSDNPFGVELDDLPAETRRKSENGINASGQRSSLSAADCEEPENPLPGVFPAGAAEDIRTEQQATLENICIPVSGKEYGDRYVFRHGGHAGPMSEPDKKNSPADEEDGFWVEKKAVDYSTGLHGANSEFVTKMAGLFSSSDGAGITDIHITENKHVWIRTGGDMVKLSIQTPQGGVSSFCSDVLRIPSSFDKANSSCEHAGKRLRLRFSKSMHNNQLFVRILPGRAPKLSAIKHEKTFEFLRGKVVPGIVFVAGATGSGKSTMLASVLQEYLNTEPLHVSTVEDPVEYLREDPDIIFIGEMRDPETAKTALTAAETGHLVFATVHASGINGIIDRLLGMLADVNDAALRLSGAFLGGIYLKLEKQEDGSFLRKTRYLFADEQGEVRRKIREMRGYELDGMCEEIANS